MFDHHWFLVGVVGVARVVRVVGVVVVHFRSVVEIASVRLVFDRTSKGVVLLVVLLVG